GVGAPAVARGRAGVESPPPGPAGPPMVRLEGVVKSFGDLVVLNRIDLTVDPGSSGDWSREGLTKRSLCRRRPLLPPRRRPQSPPYLNRYGGSLRPCLGTTIALLRRAASRQALLSGLCGGLRDRDVAVPQHDDRDQCAEHHEAGGDPEGQCVAARQRLGLGLAFLQQRRR